MGAIEIHHAGRWGTNRGGATRRAERDIRSRYGLCLGESAPERFEWDRAGDTGVAACVGDIVQLTPVS